MSALNFKLALLATLLVFCNSCTQQVRSHDGSGGEKGSHGSHERPELPNIKPFPTLPPTITPPPVAKDVCPCILKPGTKECMMYDPQFMASTVEEAILYFPDLQMNKAVPSTPTPVVPSPGVGHAPPSEALPPPPEALLAQFSPLPPIENSIRAEPHHLSNGTKNATLAKNRMQPQAQPYSGSTPTPSLCENDPECYECSAVLLNRLGTTGMLQPDELDRVSKRFGVENPNPQVIAQHHCAKYHFAQTVPSPQSSVVGVNASTYGNGSGDPELDYLVQKLKDKGEQRWREKQRKEEHSHEKTYQLHIKQKRQSGSKGGLANLGQQFKIDCTKRGDPVEQGSNWIGLCNVCWAWRKLPATYFPQYVNELVCDTDTKCMSGFGSCQQRYKSVDILQNTGTDASPVWKQVTISVANYCDCEVESGSSLHNFVAA